MKIFIVDDDIEFSEVVKEMILHGVKKKGLRGEDITDRGASNDRYSDVGGGDVIKIEQFTNAIEAISATSEQVPDLIFLDVLLDGPDGFTLLNEMQSYGDLAEVPVVLLTSLDFAGKDLSRYGVVEILNKSEMVPEQVNELVAKYCQSKER